LPSEAVHTAVHKTFVFLHSVSHRQRSVTFRKGLILYKQVWVQKIAVRTDCHQQPKAGGHQAGAGCHFTSKSPGCFLDTQHRFA